MSYSFNVKAPSKAAAKQAVSAELDKVLLHQPVHRADHPRAEAAAHAFIDVLADDDSMDVEVHVSGSVGWSGSLDGAGQAEKIVSANLSVTAYHIPRRD